mmetsp:Transcript_5536/g.16407  ORF Transcript_5536/g.16407 Transcript_5536/m.16407 type:complete len:248 (-) Transcript_5536:321-1064(-)
MVLKSDSFSATIPRRGSSHWGRSVTTVVGTTKPSVAASSTCSASAGVSERTRAGCAVGACAATGGCCCCCRCTVRAKRSSIKDEALAAHLCASAATLVSLAATAAAAAAATAALDAASRSNCPLFCRSWISSRSSLSRSMSDCRLQDLYCRFKSSFSSLSLASSCWTSRLTSGSGAPAAPPPGERRRGSSSGENWSARCGEATRDVRRTGLRCCVCKPSGAPKEESSFALAATIWAAIWATAIRGMA